LAAVSIFSLTISSASRRAFLPPSINFMQRKTMTRLDSSANIIKERKVFVRRSVMIKWLTQGSQNFVATLSSSNYAWS
jgi:hypothetical protein